MRLRVLLLLVVLALVAAACGDDDTDDSTAAPTSETTSTTEGSGATDTTVAETTTSLAAEVEDEVVVMCSLQEEWCVAAVDAFSAETGIKAEYVRLSTGEGIARLEAEAGDPSFDVWFGGPSLGSAAAAQKGLIEQYVSPNAAVVADDLKASDGTWTGIYVGALGFCSNTDLLADLGVDIPTSWDALLDPALDDNIAMADQRTSGTAVTAAATLVALEGSEDAALDYLKELHPNIFQYTRSGSAPGRMAAAGEVAVSVIFSHDCVQFGIETGAPIQVSFPEDGTGYEVGQVSLIANAAHPGAAKAFIDWVLTAKAQEVAATVNAFQIPTNPDAAVPAEAISLDDVPLAAGYSPSLAEEMRAGDFTERFGNEVRNGVAAPEG
jgi:iron(III) transport system substrate-binding protein